MGIVTHVERTLHQTTNRQHGFPYVSYGKNVNVLVDAARKILGCQIPLDKQMQTKHRGEK